MPTRRFLPALFLLFIGSGCAALIYEIVWFQLLQLVIGSSAISLGILLGTFMGGMCLGSLLLPRLIRQREHPLRVYAMLEAGIGVLGVLILVGMPLVGGIYTAWAGEGMAGIIFRAIVAGVCLLPPTILMGATLPAISRWVRATPEGVSWLGFFYGGNIAGGVFGSLAAGFYLLRHDGGRRLQRRGRRHRVRACEPDAVHRRRADSAHLRAAGRVVRARGHRALRVDGARVGSDLDAAAVAALRCNRVHLRVDPRRVSVGARHRQQRRRLARAQPRRAAPRPRLVPAAPVRGDGVVGVPVDGVAAVLAD